MAISAARPLALTSSPKRPEHMVGGFRVEIAGRLVGQQHPRAVGDRARDGDALLLAAGQFRRTMALALGEAKIAQELARPGGGLRARKPGDHLRQNEVFQRRELWQQVMELIDEADFGAPERRALVVVHRRGRGAADRHLAGVGPLQQPRQMQERRLARSRRGDQRDRLAGREREARAIQDLDRRLPAPIAAFDAIEHEGGNARRLIHTAAPPPDRASPRARRDRWSPPATGSAPSRRPRRRPWFRPARAIATGSRIQTETGSTR